MFPLDAALSGHLAATVIEVLLVDAGYQVIPLGVERIIRELRTADADRFRGVAPPRLRSLPDFFVIDPDSNQGLLAEVKFRRYLHSKLVEDIGAVQEHWAPLTLVLAVAEAPEEWMGAVRHLRVFQDRAESATDEGLLHESRREDARGFPTTRTEVAGCDHPPSPGRHSPHHDRGVNEPDSVFVITAYPLGAKAMRALRRRRRRKS